MRTGENKIAPLLDDPEHLCHLKGREAGAKKTIAEGVKILGEAFMGKGGARASKNLLSNVGIRLAMGLAVGPSFGVSLPDTSGEGFPKQSSFGTTHWSVVSQARGEGGDAQAALAKLCGAYWYPLYAYVRRQGMSAHDAQDLTQEFFARLLAKGWLASVDRDLGRFRSWLLASLKHFLANEWDRNRASKRGGGAKLFSFDELDAENRLAHEPATESPEETYSRRWAMTLLDAVMARLRTEMAGAGKLAHFEALKFCLTGEKCAYAKVGAKLSMSEGAVKVAVHRLRERYRVLLRAEVAETVSAPEEIEDELRALMAALSS